MTRGCLVASCCNVKNATGFVASMYFVDILVGCRHKIGHIGTNVRATSRNRYTLR